MINRAKMPRQLRNKGGITSVVPREKYGLGSKIKDRIRKLIPNELASVAVKAAPLVAPFNPAIAGLMRGIGRFDQRGSISDALKQGVGTFAFGAGARAFGGADPFGGGLRGGFTSPLSPERTQQFTSLFDKQQATDAGSNVVRGGGADMSTVDTGLKKLVKKAIKKLPDTVVAQLTAGGITAGASLLASYFQGDFREQEPGETMEEYLAERKKYVGTQMRTYMDNYFANDPEYMKLDDAGRDAFVARYNLQVGGRVGYGLGDLVRKAMSTTTNTPTGISMGNTLAENIARNKAAQAAFQQSIAPARERVKEQIRKRTPVQEYAMGEDSILGPLSKKAASTIIEGQDRSQAALDVLNQTMAPTGITTTDTGQAIRIGSGVPEEYDSLNKAFTEVQAPKKDIDPRARIQEAFLNERLSGGELFGDAIPGFNQLGTYIGDDPLLKDYAAAGLGTPTSQLVKLPADNPYAVSGAGYYEYDGTSFTKVADENPTPEYMKFLRSNYGLAKGGMPTGVMRVNKAGVMERDYRDKGGFVPVGIKEKADDVPAMLSKNEFVFTADAVRGAGNGSIERGAQKMYDTMKRLEKRVV